MHTIKIKVNDSIYDKFMWLINKFNKDEIEILTEDKTLLKEQKYLQNELEQIEKGEANFISIDDVEKELSNVISKYENNI